MDWKIYEEIAKEAREKAKEKEKEEKQRDIHGDYDYIWAPEKGVATVIYILVMFFGSILHARVLLWIVATLVYFSLPCMNTKK